MFKYLMKFAKSGASAVFEYDQSGNLIKYELDPQNFDQDMFEYFTQRFPKTLGIMQLWIDEKIKNVQIQKLEEDLSFDTFWLKYNMKLGKKQLAKKLWEDLPSTEKAKALKYVQLYDQELIKTGINKKFAETYIRQAIWNN